MKRVRILIAMIAAFLMIVPAALAQVKPQPVPVPNVAGMPLSAAQQALVSAGFNAVVTQENVTDPNKNNVVLKQQIAPGTTLAKGSNVPVVVGKYTAPAQQPVPNVVGMPLDRAQATLSQAKLNAAVTMQPVDQTQRNNVVLAQNVPAGKTLPPGSMVPIVVGRYTAPAQQPVPNVVGMPLDRAQATLSQAKLNAAVTMQPVDQTQRNNVVLAQNVPAGKTLPPGSMVPIVVGRYTAPAQQPVPNVVGMPLDRAQATLSQAKLNAAVTMQLVDQTQRNNVVLAQNVPAGKTLPPGSMVPIVVGRYTAPAQQPVPNATGMKADTARQMLEKQGWKVNIEERSVGDSRQAGMVLQQVPPPGTQVQQKNQPVTLVVGKAQETVQVPQVAGMKLQEAQAALAKVKLNAQVSSQPVANPQQNGVVIGQRVAPGTTVAPGSMVPVIVGAYTAPARPAVPNVTGMPVAEAQKTLAAGRLNAVVSLENVTDQGKKGIVLKQQIAAGTALDPGSQVPLVVGRYVEPLRVPSVVGMKGEQAKAVLEQAKLKMNAGARTVQDRTKIGTVLDQNPAPGTAVEPGSQVIVTMGLDPNKKINLPPSNPYSPYNPPIPADGTSSRK